MFATHIPPLVIVLAAACGASALSEWTRRIGARHTLQVGIDARRVEGAATDRITPPDGDPIVRTAGGEQRFAGVCVQDSIRASRALELMAAVRVDGFELRDGIRDVSGETTRFTDRRELQASPRIGALYRIHEALALRGSIYRAFRAPTLNELYRPFQVGTVMTAARDRLLKALDARKGSTMTINSALRTVAQQYLVWRWSASKRCGVQLATPPGESNHETGLALDIAEQADWRQTLEAHEFHWLGAIDRVHFDYKGTTGSSSTQRATDVLAFQQLWNKNNPSDAISETGRYNAETEKRLKKAPADGFAIGATCKGRGNKASATANTGKQPR